MSHPNTTVPYRPRWAEMDPNGPMRHSAYADFAADARITLLAAAGFDLRRFTELRIGPILFREETRFLKELHLGEEINVDARPAQLKDDGSRWTIVHGIYKADGHLAATVTVDGAWIDLDRRKLAVPPVELTEMMRGLEPYVE